MRRCLSVLLMVCGALLAAAPLTAGVASAGQVPADVMTAPDRATAGTAQVGRIGTTESELVAGNPDEVTVIAKDATPRAFLVPYTGEVSEIRILDEWAGRDALILRTERDGASTRVYTSQLDRGRYTFTWPGGSYRLQVGTMEDDFSVLADDGGAPFVVLLTTIPVFAFGFVVLLRRRRVLGVSAICAGALIASALVVVPSSGSSVQSIVAAIEARCPDGNECRSYSYVDVYDRYGPETFREVLASTGYATCHEQSHEAAFMLWRRDRSIPAALSLFTSACAYGSIHGTLEAIGATTDAEQFAPLIVELCSATREPSLSQACWHAVGHAAVWHSNADLPTAYALCDDVGVRYANDPYLCHAAATMELSDRWSTKHSLGLGPTPIPDPVDPLEICLDGPDDDEFQRGCYIRAIGAHVSVIPDSLSAEVQQRTAESLVAYCTNRSGYARSCFSALGENWTLFVDPQADEREVTARLVELVDTMCGAGPDAASRDECMREVVRTRAGLTKDIAEAERLCTMIDAQFTASCEERVRRFAVEISDIRTE